VLLCGSIKRGLLTRIELPIHHSTVLMLHCSSVRLFNHSTVLPLPREMVEVNIAAGDDETYFFACRFNFVIKKS